MRTPTCVVSLVFYIATTTACAVESIVTQENNLRSTAPAVRHALMSATRIIPLVAQSVKSAL